MASWRMAAFFAGAVFSMGALFACAEAGEPQARIRTQAARDMDWPRRRVVVNPWEIYSQGECHVYSARHAGQLDGPTPSYVHLPDNRLLRLAGEAAAAQVLRACGGGKLAEDALWWGGMVTEAVLGRSVMVVSELPSAVRALREAGVAQPLPAMQRDAQGRVTLRFHTADLHIDGLFHRVEAVLDEAGRLKVEAVPLGMAGTDGTP